MLQMIESGCLLFLILLFFPLDSDTQITIDVDGDLVKWEGCVFRRVNISVNVSNPCYRCSENDQMAIIPQSLKDWPQPYINCTEHCEHRTICTKAKYFNGVDNFSRSLCYDCENRKNEEIVFEFVRDDELCGKNCSECASTRDIAQATACAKVCHGRPTFCFPIQHWFGKSIKCYKATYWYGMEKSKVFSL